MAEEAEQKSNVPLPPKLNLRKTLPQASPAPATPATPAAPAAPRPTLAPGQAVVSTSAAPSGPESSTTMHIKLSDDASGVKIMRPQGSVPAPASSPTVVVKSTPTVEIRKPAAQPSPAPSLTVKPLTVTPAPVAAAAPAAPKLASKSETSRIPLELATSALPAGKPTGDLKTIKIKPAPAAAGVRVTAPVPVAPVQPAPAERPMDDKRKTSRISLEAALAMEDKAGDAGGGVPKTIRLKRPGETASKASPTLDTIKADPGAGRAAMSHTARLDEQIPDEEEGPTPTRRKTIKVKRPTDRPDMPVAAGDGEASEAVESAGAGAGEVVAIRADRFGVFDWVAIAVAIFTMVSTFVVMMMLASQAWGPNSCLTELSSWKTGPDIAWAGKTPPMAP